MQTLTRLGEMEADREHFDRAAAVLEPHRRDRAGEAGFVSGSGDGVLGLLSLRRRAAADRAGAAAAAEPGAVRVSKPARSMKISATMIRAMREYARGRAGAAGWIERGAAAAVAGAAAGAARAISNSSRITWFRRAIRRRARCSLRVALLRNQNRRDDLEKLLLALAARTDSRGTAAVDRKRRARGRISESAAGSDRTRDRDHDRSGGADAVAAGAGAIRRRPGTGRARRAGDRRAVSRKSGDSGRRAGGGGLSLAQSRIRNARSMCWKKRRDARRRVIAHRSRWKPRANRSNRAITRGRADSRRSC